MSDVYEFDPLNPNVPALQESGRKEATLAFVRSMVWYLETMTERGRPYKDGRRPYIKLRRFCPGIPYASVRAVLDALTDINVITDPVISGHIEPGKWRATFTHYRKDSRYERVDSKDATATIYQDLVPFYEDGEGEEIDGGGDCKRVRSLTYVWEAATIETPPRPYPVGVSYAVQSVQRNDETGLFDYVLVREESIEIHEEPYVSRRAAGVVQKTERWYNAHEIPEGLPKEGESFDEQGRLVEVSIQKNDDCTYDIVVQTTETEEYEAKEACMLTTMQHEHSITRAGQDEPLGEAPAAGGGIYYRHNSDRESDGTYTNTVVTVCEIPLPEQQVQKSKTLDGTRVTTAHKNLTSVPVKELNVGETMAFSVNDGGSYDVTLTCFELCDERFIGRSSCKTISAEIETISEVTPEYGEEAATVDEGTMVAISYCQTDLGTWRRTESTTVETPVEDKRVSKNLTLDGVVIRTVHQHQPKDTKCEVVNIGDTVTLERTEGDLIDIDVQQLDRESFVCRVISDTAQASMFSDEHSQTCASLDALTCVGGIGQIQRAGGGTVYRAASCLTDIGTYRNTESVTCELPQENAVLTTDVTVGKRRTRKESRNLLTQAQLDGLGTVSNGLTDGGAFNSTVITTELVPEEWAYKRSQSVFEDVTLCHFAGYEEIVKEAESDKDTVMVDRDMQDGGYTTIVQHTEPKFAWAVRGGGEDFDTISCSGQDRNCSKSFFGQLGAAPVIEYKEGQIVAYCSAQTGIEGSYNVGWNITTAKEYWYESTTFEGRCSTEVIFTFGNSKVYIPAVVRSAVASISKSNLLSVSPSVSRDRFGNWNGVVSIRILTQEGGGGGGGDFVEEYEKSHKVYHTRMTPTSDGQQVETLWSAEFVYGFDKDIGNANKKVEENHDSQASLVYSGWQPGVSPQRSGGSRAQWAANYHYYRKPTNMTKKDKKENPIVTNKDGQTNSEVTGANSP